LVHTKTDEVEFQIWRKTHLTKRIETGNGLTAYNSDHFLCTIFSAERSSLLCFLGHPDNSARTVCGSSTLRRRRNSRSGGRRQDRSAKSQKERFLRRANDLPGAPFVPSRLCHELSFALNGRRRWKLALATRERGRTAERAKHFESAHGPKLPT
jgi:hypothetical protein